MEVLSMRRLSILLAAGALLSAQAQFFNLFQKGPSVNTDVTGMARLEPSSVVVGQPCAVLLELDVEKSIGIENLQVGGLPDADGGKVVYGDGFENLADGKSAKAGRIVKRFRLPVRFLAPVTQDVSMVVQGMATVQAPGGLFGGGGDSLRDDAEAGTGQGAPRRSSDGHIHVDVRRLLSVQRLARRGAPCEGVQVVRPEGGVAHGEQGRMDAGAGASDRLSY